MKKNPLTGNIRIFPTIVFILLLFTCEPIEPELSPTPEPTPESSAVGIALEDDDFRSWADGTYACSCYEYRYPGDPDYAYKDNTGTGFYRILPEGAIGSLDVYCDMSAGDPRWTLVLLNSEYGTPPTPGWADAIMANNVEGAMLNGIFAGFDQLLGLKYWEGLGTTLRVETGDDPITIQHRAYYTFNFDEDDRYSIHLSDEVIDIGSTSPGLFTSHNHSPLTT